MKHTLYLLAIGTTIVTGCGGDKEEAPLVLAGEYQVGSTIVAGGPIRMYTKNGEIKNDQAIDTFLKRLNTWTSSEFCRTDVPTGNTGTFKVIIRENGKVSLVSITPTCPDTLKAEITNRTPEYLVVSDIDSINSYPSYNTGAANHCRVIADKMNLVIPPTRCRSVSMASGTYENFCKWRALRVIGIKDGQLFIPQLSWVFHNVSTIGGYRSNCGESRTGDKNLFNPAVLNQLVEGDTLVVQQRKVMLAKK